MLYLLIATLIWASSFIVGKVAISAFDPVQIMQIRLTLAAFIALPFLFLRIKNPEKSAH